MKIGIAVDIFRKQSFSGRTVRYWNKLRKLRFFISFMILVKKMGY